MNNIQKRFLAKCDLVNDVYITHNIEAFRIADTDMSQNGSTVVDLRMIVDIHAREYNVLAVILDSGIRYLLVPKIVHELILEGRDMLYTDDEIRSCSGYITGCKVFNILDHVKSTILDKVREMII